MLSARLHRRSLLLICLPSLSLSPEHGLMHKDVNTHTHTSGLSLAQGKTLFRKHSAALHSLAPGGE